ncbi:hypothetical protein FHG66_19945 [Rubellimicrobium rubrum]|uniref:Creatinase N-terminal domain-containing protein n=1 Tax=Rubellimicrobium rubrum TaxID=2585369 RepID=A0A5C4MNE9_9RHOB|nr:hypothetical protein FHG66_19945 [Rubellimicrobium rubrum]
MTATTPRLARLLRECLVETGTDLVVLGPTSHMRWLADLDPQGDERPVMLLVSTNHVGVLMPALNAASARQATDLPFYEWSDANGPDAGRADLLAAYGDARLSARRFWRPWPWSRPYRRGTTPRLPIWRRATPIWCATSKGRCATKA